MRRQSRLSFEDRQARFGSLAATVALRRLELGLRQDELAALADVATNTVVDLERGRTTIRLDKLASILQALGLHLEVAHGVHDAPVSVAPPVAQPPSTRRPPDTSEVS
jgi:HTH-type transcriptional regulator/antitoxin HipB